MTQAAVEPQRHWTRPVCDRSLSNLTYFVDLLSLHSEGSFFAKDMCSMAVPTWTTAQAKMSVEINGTYVPFNSAPDSMPRFVRPALFSTGDDVWELRLFGTAFLATFHGWSFAIVTAHQTDVAKGAPAADQFRVVVKRGNRNLAVPPSSLHRPVIDDEDRQSLKDLTVDFHRELTRD